MLLLIYLNGFQAIKLVSMNRLSAVRVSADFSCFSPSRTMKEEKTKLATFLTNFS